MFELLACFETYNRALIDIYNMSTCFYCLQIKENEDLRRAHAKHHDRLRVIQTNYRTVTKQLKEAEENHDL